MTRMLLVALGVGLLACGSDEEAQPGPNPPVLRVVFAANGNYMAQAATESTAPPVTLVFRFLGPDGALEQRVAYETGRLEVDDLRAGRWRVAAEGLDERGLVTWQASAVVFDVREDRSTDVTLFLEPI